MEIESVPGGIGIPERNKGRRLLEIVRRTAAGMSCAAALACACAAVPAEALAHRVNIFAYADGDAVRVECSFSRSRMVRNGRLTMTDAATGAVLAETQTDEHGICRYVPPASLAGQGHGLRIVLNAGEGHRSEWTVAPEDIKALLPAAGPEGKGAEAPASAGTARKGSVEEAAGTARSGSVNDEPGPENRPSGLRSASASAAPGFSPLPHGAPAGNAAPVLLRQGAGKSVEYAAKQSEGAPDARTEAPGLSSLPQGAPAGNAAPVFLRQGAGKSIECAEKQAADAPDARTAAPGLSAQRPGALSVEERRLITEAAAEAVRSALASEAGALASALAPAVEAAVEARIAPLRRMIAEERDRGPSLKDIVGGLGWFLGLFGIGVLLRSRRGGKDREKS